MHLAARGEARYGLVESMQHTIPAFVAAIALLSLGAAPDQSRDRSAAIYASKDGSRLVVANPDSSSVTLIDARTRTKVAEIGLACTPQTLTGDAERAFVACRDGRVMRVDLEGRAVAATSSRIGTELYGIVSDGQRLFASDYGGAVVRVLDAETLEPLATIPTVAYPRGLALEGSTLYVTHFRSGRISVIDTDELTVTRVIDTESDANLTQAVAVLGDRAYVPQTRSRSGNPALLFDTTLFPIVSVIDLPSGVNLPSERFSIDVIDQPVNMPIDAVATSGGKLYVVNAGSDDVTMIHLEARVALAHIEVGSNPRSIALSPDQRFAWVNNALSGTVTVIDTTSDTAVGTIVSTTIPLRPEILRGKILFNNSSRPAMSKDHWISCASCHFEGGTDGRTWFFRDGPRNTPALFGVASTLPIHWSGDLDEIQDVEQTIRLVQFGAGLVSGDVCVPTCDTAPRITGHSQDLDDLAAFIKRLEARRRDVPVNDAIRRGQALFASTGCGSCHPAPLYTDRKKHDVGTGGPLERNGDAFDTPSLRGLFDTAPYFHDGSAATLGDVLARHAGGPALSADEREDLAAFLASIPFPEPKRRSVHS